MRFMFAFESTLMIYQNAVLTVYELDCRCQVNCFNWNFPC